MKKKKLKILKLSKDMQKEFVGGQVVKVAEYDCTNDTCFGAFDRVVTYDYKTNR